MRLLVTGGAGFIGSHYVRSVLDGSLAGPTIANLTVLDKLTYAGRLENLAGCDVDPRYRFVQGDICDPNLVGELIAEHDVVVNFAAESHVDRSIASASDFIATNVAGTQTLLDAILHDRATRMVHVSTDEVYGSIDSGAWTEQSPLEPNSPYSASKAAADLLARAYHRTHGLDVRVTRCSNNYGTHQFPEKVIPLFITNLIDGLRVPLYGDGLNVRDWLNVADHCRGIHLVLAGGRPGEVYNIGGGIELTNRELTERLLALLGADWSMVKPVEDRLGHDRRYCVSWDKIRDELGYQPLTSFDQGLAATVDWFKSNESWWRTLKAQS